MDSVDSMGPPCLFSAEEIADRVRGLGAELRGRFPGPLTLLGILKGAALFTADLARALGEPLELTFVHAASYGAARRSSGAVDVGPLQNADIEGRTVVVSDTVLDTGLTLREVVRRVESAGALDVVTCVLLDKPARREVDVQADLVGFTIPDRFVVGYGLDHGGKYRALDYVGALDG